MKEYRLTENFWTSQHFGNFNLIKDCFKGKENLSFLEIGTFEGKTTTWLLDNVLIDSNSKIFCIDSDIKENGKYNLSLHGEKVVLQQALSEIALQNLLNTYRDYFDFIYIDGDHHAYAILQDVIVSWKLLKCGGIMLLDDYGIVFKDARMISPKVAIDAFLAIYQGHYELIIKNFQVGVKKIKNYTPLEMTPSLFKQLQEGTA